MTQSKAPRSQGVREFLNTPAGKAVSIVFILLMLGLVVYEVHGAFGASETESFANTRTFICSETLKPYQYELTTTSKIPAPSPFSGKNTGYPAELCYWTKDGKIKGPNEKPTPVLLNTYRKQPEPTFCPECGRLVVARNPQPNAGAKPPPTEADFKASGRRPPPTE